MNAVESTNLFGGTTPAISIIADKSRCHEDHRKKQQRASDENGGEEAVLHRPQTIAKNTDEP